MKSIVQISHGAIVELVETAKVVQEGHQTREGHRGQSGVAVRLDLRQLNAAVDQNVKYWEESQTLLAEVGRKGLDPGPEEEALRELVVDVKMALEPVLLKLIIWRHFPTELRNFSSEI